MHTSLETQTHEMTELKEQSIPTVIESKTLAFIGRLTIRQLKNHQAQGLRNTVKESDLAEILSTFTHQYMLFHSINLQKKSQEINFITVIVG